MKQEHTLTMLMKQYLSTVEYLRKKIKPLSPKPQLSDFYHPSESKKRVNYYLLLWAQACKHMIFTNFLNKWQTKK